MAGTTSLDFEQLTRVDDLAAFVGNQYEEWYSAFRPLHEKWDEIEQYLFATSTRETSNANVGGFSSEEGNRNGFSHSTHYPKLCNCRDLLSSQYLDALFSTDDWLRFKGYDQSSSTLEMRKKAQEYVLTKWRLSASDVEVQRLIDDWIDTGNSFAFVDYIQETEPVDEDLKGFGYHGPKLYRINPRDIVFNVLSPSWDRSPKIVRSIKTLSELYRDAEDHPELGYSSEILDLIRQKRITAKPMHAHDINKHKQIQKCGFGTPAQYLKSDYVEILEFYGDMMFGHEYLKDHVITIVDRQVVLRKQPTNVKIRHCAWRRRRDNLMGMSPLENVVGIQYTINHLYNMFADLLDESLIPTVIKIGDIQETGIPKFGGILNSEYSSDSMEGKVDFIRPDASIFQANFGIEMLENKIESYVGAPRELGGIRTPGEKTAYEVEQLQQAAYRLFNNRILAFQKEFLEPLVNDFLIVGRRNLSGLDLIEQRDQDLGIDVFTQITKEDLTVNGKLIPVGARHFIERNKFLREATQFFQNLAQDPEVQQHFSSVKTAEMLERAMDVSNFKVFEPFVRITERQESARMSQAAQAQVIEEAGVPVGGSPMMGQPDALA